MISGGGWPEFEKQVLGRLPQDAVLKNLSLLPTGGTKFYRYSGDWRTYSEDFTSKEKTKIIASLKKALDESSQTTYSALWQEAPLEEKKKSDPDYTKRETITALASKLIPEFSVRMGGAASIDVTNHGIDKAYGIRKLRDIVGITLREIIFISDAVFPGGNDYPPERAGVVSVCVQGPHETKRVVEGVIGCVA